MSPPSLSGSVWVCANVMLLRYVWDTKIPFCYDDDAQRIIKKYSLRTHKRARTEKTYAHTGIMRYQPSHFKYFLFPLHPPIMALHYNCVDEHVKKSIVHDELIDKNKNKKNIRLLCELFCYCLVQPTLNNIFYHIQFVLCCTSELTCSICDRTLWSSKFDRDKMMAKMRRDGKMSAIFPMVFVHILLNERCFFSLHQKKFKPKIQISNLMKFFAW